MTKVFHIALIAPNGYSNKGIMDGFMQAGFVDYKCFDFQLERYQIGKDLMQRAMIHEAEKMKPDLIFAQIQSSDIIDLETWQALSKIAFTVNFTFDIRINEKTQWMYNLVPHIGLMCFSNQEDVDECNRRGYNNVMCLQSSADPDIYKPDETKERKGVVFIGNNFMNTNHQFPLSKERVEMVEFLQKEFPDDFKVYGNNWDGSKMIGQKEEVEIYQSAAIVVCHNNFNHTLYQSDRIWRAMMCGVLCLTKHFKGVEKLFDVDVLDWWPDFHFLKEKIEYYLARPESAKRIGEAGRQYVLANHTWTARIKEMMGVVQNIKSQDVEVYYADACLKAGAHVINGVIPGQPGDEFEGVKECDCKRLKGFWSDCGCGAEKTLQFRWEQNI